jgi:Inner membrane protein YgaP-like, transmembrane domain
MNGLFDFLASSAGRLTRIAAGVVLILAGIFAISGVVGVVIAIIGVVPLAAGVFDVCVFAPLFGLPFAGPALRRVVHQ